jgi:hypothetical protein
MRNFNISVQNDDFALLLYEMLKQMQFVAITPIETSTNDGFYTLANASFEEWNEPENDVWDSLYEQFKADENV